MIAYLLTGMATAYFVASAKNDGKPLDIFEASIIMIAWPALIAALISARK